MLAVFTVVVVPDTVRSPVITAFPPTFNSEPTYNFFATPKPPATVRAPSVALVLSVIFVTDDKPLAVNVEKEAVPGVPAPMFVPSIDPPLISTLVAVNVASVASDTFLSVRVIKSVSAVTPIELPSIVILSTVKDVNVPTDVILGCAASTLNT